MLAQMLVAVEQVPQLGPLALRVPLAELVPERKDPLLGAGLLLVAAGAAESNFIANEVLRTGMTRGIDIDFINDLSDKHFIVKMLSEFFHPFSEILYID